MHNEVIPTEEEEEEGEEDGEEEEEEEEDSRRTSNRNYSLRRKPTKVVRYEDNSFSEPKPRGMYHTSYSPGNYHQRFPMNSRRGRRRGAVQSPRRSRNERRERRARHQSTTSESDSETGKDEAKFEKRKKKSMNQARARCLPMNLTIEDIQKGRCQN